MEEALVLLITGMAVGFASGLLGVGGCFIMVPVQYWLYTSMGMDPQRATMIAFGTNLLVVFVTAMSGAYAHSKKGTVFWKAAVVLGITGALGSFAGSAIAALLPKNLLRLAFGIGTFLAGFRMLTAKPPSGESRMVKNPLIWAVWGFPVGVISGIIGIGGGVFMVPVMTLALGFPIHTAVGTSVALMIFTGLGGALGYMYQGIKAGMPFITKIGHMIGYVNLDGWLLLSVTSVLMAQVGARASHKLPAKRLKLVFVLVMFYMGWKMIESGLGLNLPI